MSGEIIPFRKKRQIDTPEFDVFPVIENMAGNDLSLFSESGVGRVLRTMMVAENAYVIPPPPPLGIGSDFTAEEAVKKAVDAYQNCDPYRYEYLDEQLEKQAVSAKVSPSVSLFDDLVRTGDFTLNREGSFIVARTNFIVDSGEHKSEESAHRSDAQFVIESLSKKRLVHQKEAAKAALIDLPVTKF